VEELETTVPAEPAAAGSGPYSSGWWDARWASRLVSLYDPDARPIRKGRIGHPIEFGDKALMLDYADGIMLDHQVMVGNPPDAPLLAPAIGRVIARIGKPPRAVTADRG
jgi:IS5 family transposase